MEPQRHAKKLTPPPAVAPPADEFVAVLRRSGTRWVLHCYTDDGTHEGVTDPVDPGPHGRAHAGVLGVWRLNGSAATWLHAVGDSPEERAARHAEEAERMKDGRMRAEDRRRWRGLRPKRGSVRSILGGLPESKRR